MSFVEAAERPFETIMSGPVAGAEGAAELARALDLGDVITADVGGTSFDTALIIRGRPRLIYEGAVAGLTVQSPWIDVRSIGAGGGSIASIDVGGLLQVGPASAGAVPGPACYGRGGTEPTVTDAAFVLGMLGEGRLASGVVLDRTAAVGSIAPLADALGLEPEDVARGIVTIANANMANAIRSITIEQGEDPRGAALMPFGGAGPLFGTLLARELEMKNLVLPPYAGNFSAWGLLGADLTQSASRTRLLRLGPEGIVAANEVLAELFMKLERRRQGHDDDAFEREVRLDMRYVGQEHTITIPVPVTDAGAIAVGPEEIEASFTEEYSQRFGHTMPVPVEISSVRATIRTPLPERRMGYRSPGTNGNGGGTVSAYSFTRGDRLDFQIVERSALVEGDVVEGPAIVVEETATTYLDADFVGQVGAAAALHITDTGQEA